MISSRGRNHEKESCSWNVRRRRFVSGSISFKRAGYDVIGVTMQIWQDESQEQIEDNGGCCGITAVDDARRVAMQLDIPYYVMNFKMNSRKM